MKKSLLAMLCALLGIAANAQTSVPNGNFENWNQSNFDNPSNYAQTSNVEVYGKGLPFNCVKTSDAYHGLSAIQITSVGNSNDQMFGYFINAQNPEGDPSQWHGGIPFTDQPTGIRGYFKSNIATGDTGLAFVAFSKNGVNIGLYVYKFTGQQNTYSAFELTFDPPLSQTPDSMIFGATSSNAIADQMVVGSTLTLDSISLLGISTQPEKLNGDFENWENGILESLAGWNRQDNWDTTGQKTSDAYKGNYAVRLSTYLGENNGQMRASAMNISTGYYLQNCNPCNEMGGYPYTNQTDTLVFWYKYVAAGGSKGVVMFTVKLAGQNIGGNYTELEPNATFQKMEIPMQVMQTPDTLIVQFQSSRWEDSLSGNVGAYLIVDEVQLKSAPLNTSVFLPGVVHIKVYPNPAKDRIVFDAGELALKPGTQVILSNGMGQKVKEVEWLDIQQSIGLEGFPPGLYFYQVNSPDGRLKSGSFYVE